MISQGITHFLGSLPLFRDLGSAEVERLAHGGTEIATKRGHAIFRQGEPSKGLHLVVRGQVKLSLQTARGNEKVIELIGPGASFGEVALFLGEPYIMSADAIADSSLVLLGREVVLDEIRRNAGFSRRMLKEVCRRLSQRTRDLESCMLLSGTQRVAAYLLSQLPHGVNGRPVAVTLPVKKGIIASRLNLTHEHFSRILHDIQVAGLIEVRGREIRVIDVGRLRGYPG
jgi:CRP/FNR family transcriptional regulator, dissimilatory nitrate respiration regulator